MNNIITANDLKVKGISIIEDNAKQGIETIVTVRGQAKYVILPTDQYNYLRECELSAAITEAENDIKEGKYNEDSIENHIKRITNA